MSNTHEQLSRRDQLLIESYKEQAAAWKHEDNLLHRFTSVILPLSIAALALPYVQKDVPHMLATLGGLTLMTFWAFSCQITHIKANIRFSITNKIEKCWKIPGHKDFKAIRKNTYGEKGSDFLRSHFLRCWMFRIYLGIVVLLTLHRRYESCSPRKIITLEFIDPLIIIGVIAIIYFFVDRAMCKAKKDVGVIIKDNTAPSDTKTERK